MKRLRDTLPRGVWRVLIGIVGGVVVLAGVVMIPYPGPGWLVVFAGLAVLSQEFAWARRLLDYGKAKFKQWEHWAAAQHWSLKLVLFLFTAAVVIATIWLCNGYGLLNHWLHLHQDWLASPFVK